MDCYWLQKKFNCKQHQLTIILRPSNGVKYYDQPIWMSALLCQKTRTYFSRVSGENWPWLNPSLTTVQ